GRLQAPAWQAGAWGGCSGEGRHVQVFETILLKLSINGVILLICLFGLVGNGIVLWFLSFHIKRNLFTVYILNLGMANFGFLLFLAPVSPLAISIERCLSILFPIWCPCHRPKHLSAIVCSLLWVLSSLLIELVHYFCVLNRTKKCPMTVISMHVLNFLIFTPITVLSNLILSIKVQCSSQQCQPGKLYAVILLTVLFFLVFTGPLSVQSFVLHFNDLFLPIWICLMLASVNSNINPFIYFLVGSYRKWRFRGSVKIALQGVFEENCFLYVQQIRGGEQSSGTA
uniref:G-protein coupled receptors family 1 profile domain-containing protein n=1 Tax=Terrapene triunguis TaxID=2587831 RepID=A0A674J5S5_9SAUR